MNKIAKVIDMRKAKDGSIIYSKREIAQFRRAALMLAKLGKAGALLYLEEDTLNLMSGHSHDTIGHRIVARQDRVVEGVYIQGASGGGW